MADNVDPLIDMLLTRFPECFKLSTTSPARASTPLAQVTSAQPGTGDLEPSACNDREDAMARETTVDVSNTKTDNVGESE